MNTPGNKKATVTFLEENKFSIYFHLFDLHALVHTFSVIIKWLHMLILLIY